METKTGMHLLFAASIGLLGAFSSQARAEIKFCNRSPKKIYMALAAKNTNEPSWGSWATGWWTAEPGECQTVYDSEIYPWEWYGAYATSGDGTEWPNQGPYGHRMVDTLEYFCATPTWKPLNYANHPGIDPHTSDYTCPASLRRVIFTYFVTGERHSEITLDFL